MIDRPDLAEVAACQARIESERLPATLGDLVADRAATLGERIACDWFEDTRAVSYRELDRAAHTLAWSLLALGVRKGTHVAVMLPNVPETFITWVAIARIGAVMVPINTGYTAAELGFVLDDSDAQFIVIDAGFLQVLDALDPRPAMIGPENVIVRAPDSDPAPMRRLETLIEARPTPFVAPVPIASGDLLNIQYTSGTTGFPKGCLLTHEYWIRTGYSLAITRGDDHGIRNVLVWAPFYYMDGMWQVLSSFFLGATAYIARRMQMSRFLDWLERYEINACTFPEPALKAFPPSPADDRLALRYIYSFGWRGEAKREAEERFGCHARDAYGMTELGTATVTPIAAGKHNFDRTCGLPAPDRELRIVNESGREVAPGGTGELQVRGPGMMWGYYKRPRANAGSFDGDWFRTGDVFRQDAHGYYHIVGRIKDMVRRAGENIAAREVESVLNAMPGIEESAVVPVPDERRGEEVKAYVRLLAGESAANVSPQHIIEHCARSLAAFKLPRYIAYVDDFPRTPTRKVAKHRLIGDATDLRSGAFDRVDDTWR